MTTHIYFVAETKGSLASMDLRGIEQTKMAGSSRISVGEMGSEIGV